MKKIIIIALILFPVILFSQKGAGKIVQGSGGTSDTTYLEMPSGLTVTGSPASGTDTLTVTTTLNGSIRGNGSGFTTGNLNLTTETTGLGTALQQFRTNAGATAAEWFTPPTYITGSGTNTNVAYWTGASTLAGTSSFSWNGSGLGIGTASAAYPLHVQGTTSITKIGIRNAATTSTSNVCEIGFEALTTTQNRGLLQMQGSWAVNTDASRTTKVGFATVDGGLLAENFTMYGNRFGIGNASPTARLHLTAGTATASTAPQKFTTGVSQQTVIESGAVNWDGSRLYIGNASSANKTFAFLDDLGTIANGGTGLTSLGTANQLLRVNAGATALEYFTPPYLTSETNLFSGDLTNLDSAIIHTDNFGWKIEGTGRKTLEDDDGGSDQSIVDAGATSASISGTDGGGNSASIFARRDGEIRLASSNGDIGLTTAPPTDSDVAGDIMVHADTDGKLKSVDRASFEVLTGTGSPVDGTTKAWAKGQIYIDTTISASPIIYYAANKSTDPDAAATGSKWKKYLRSLLVDADGDTKVDVEESADEDIIRFDAAGSQIATMSISSIAMNPDGLDQDFVVETDNDGSALYVDAGNDLISVGVPIYFGNAYHIITSTYTSTGTIGLTDQRCYTRINAVSGAQTYTLPTAADGMVLIFKRIDNNPATVITFTGTVDGVTDPTSTGGGSPIASLAIQYSSLTLIYNGSSWDVIN